MTSGKRVCPADDEHHTACSSVQTAPMQAAARALTRSLRGGVGPHWGTRGASSSAVLPSSSATISARGGATPARQVWKTIGGVSEGGSDLAWLHDCGAEALQAAPVALATCSTQSGLPLLPAVDGDLGFCLDPYE